MKPLRHFFSRALDACKPGRGKAGNSLALVMMVGAALVIWVMCIMPLMATTGTTAAKTKQNYDDYLDSRSSIEYCKSELQDIVTREMPYTFAVIRNTDADGKIFYSAVRKYDKVSKSLTDAYKPYITYDATDDTKDVPKDTEEGNKVAAICAVGPESGGVYDITITTFHNGEKGQSYSLSFTVSGSLLIFPESYKQNDALPLSDFAVVDGKMGANQVWDSTIKMENALNGTGSGNFTETLLPWKLAPDAGYADTGEYPAAFKKTANAAPADASAIGEPLTDGEFTNENWIVPTAVSGSGNKPGEIWWDYESGNIAVYLYKSDQNTRFNITNDCTIYLNGKKSDDKAVPKQEGYYCITVDYNGTGAYDPSENAVNILPASGLRMPVTIDAVPKKDIQKQTPPDPAEYTIAVEKNDGTLKVTLKANDGADTDNVLYAYCGESDSTVQVNWSESNEFDNLDATKTWYFYACRAAKIIEEKDDNGNLIRRVFKEDSVAVNLGAVCPLEFATSLDNNTAYAIVGGSEGSYFAMDGNLDAVSISDSYMVVPSGDSISIPTWTAEGSENQWALKNGNEKNGYKYLNLSGKCDWGPTNWSFDKGTTTNSTFLTVDFTENSDATVWKEVSCTCSFWFWSETYTEKACLAFNNGSFTAQQGTNATVKFLKVPNVSSAPSVTSPSDYRLYDKDVTDGKFVLKYEDESLKYVKTHISPDAKPVRLYANGKEFTTLDAGVYYITAELEVAIGENVYETRYADLGMLTIQKSTDNSAPDLTINQSAEDDLTVTITTNAPAYGSDNNSNMLHFGYRADGEQDFHWFPADKDNKQSRTFRLMPGKYQFAVCRFGDSTYEAVTTSDGYEITFRYEELTEENKVEFLYTFDKDSGTVWYKLPERILPCRVKLVFGSPIGDTDINWSETYTEGKTTYYGVIVENSNHSDLNTVLQVPPPVGITNLNDRTTSMMRGSSLYFMGRDSSINTYGNSVYLTADLVVLNKGIDQTTEYTEKGHVYVTPYSSGGDAPGDVLLFTVNDITCNNGVMFNARTFYRVPKDTDLCNPTGVTELGDVQTKEVKDLFRLGVYPEINLDIAYASDEQLAHVVSSETIRWTADGKLGAVNDSNTNASYVVCAYVSNINGSVSYKANRVLIATGDDSRHTLSVPANLTFTTRYLSIDAENVIQTNSGVKFTINNLGQDGDFLSWLGNVTGLTPYHSKTLQVDFERTTKIIDSNGKGSELKRQICRYENGANLFDGVEPQSLMVTYTTSEVKRWFNIVSTSAKTVDRYVTLKSDSGSSLDISALGNCKLNIYANYIYMDPSITSIGLKSVLGEGDITINSQEKGYNDKEYLGLFTDNSAESYSGTLLYFPNKVNVTLGWGNNYEIEPGFYHIKAEQSGISIKELAEKYEQYKVSEEDLKSLSVYIKKDGSISNAYVDTGIWTNTNTGLGGFSGGNVG